MTQDRREKLRLKVEGLREVSTIPTILKKVLEVVEDEGSSAGDLEEVIEHDQSLASRILCMANAAFYGQSRQVDTITRAIYVLGFDMVKCITISITIFDTINCVDEDIVKRLWCHSFEVALLSKLIGEKTGSPRADSAFTAGLLHDIGRAILFQLFGKGYLDHCIRVDADKLLDVEDDIMGAPHPLVGAWFSERCLMPRECVVSIEYHHTPESSILNRYDSNGAKELTSIVYLGELLASQRRSGFESDSIPSPRHKGILKSIGVNKGLIKDVNQVFDEMSGSVEEFYHLALGR